MATDYSTEHPYTYIASLERAFCSNYTCCNTSLRDLHALLDHVDRVHPGSTPDVDVATSVVDLDLRDYSPTPPPSSPSYSSSSSDTNSYPSSPTSPTPLPLPSDFAFDDYTPPSPIPDLELCFRTATSSPSASPDPAAHPPADAWWAAPVDADEYFALSGLPSISAPPVPLPAKKPRRVRARDSHSPLSPAKGKGKNMALVLGPDATPAGGKDTSSDKDKDKEPKRRREREKAYRCPTLGCTKSYLNPNGLKYHLEKGTCKIEEPVVAPPAPPVSVPTAVLLPQLKMESQPVDVDRWRNASALEL
ncbi:hypothetical protein BD779DRAFT_1678207 [Infundibulicybe gibba]|nr:hypothetical protein BD779DRAFT_1678207 [Infundibulicybe gibba]